MLSKSFKSGKCKTSLKLAASRIKLLKNKRDIQVKHLRRELAQLLATGQEQTARIRVEHVIREEKTMSAYDLIEIYCELIVARLPIIESQKSCPIDLKEAITSLIFASPRCADIPELVDARKHFVAKYGKEFSTNALELRPNCGVNHMIVEKLSAHAPDIDTKIKILIAIAKEHDVKWDPKAFEELQKPAEDLLSGSSSFIRSNKPPMESKAPVESSNDDFSSVSNQKEASSRIVQNEITSNPNSFNSSSRPNSRTFTSPLTPTQNESMTSDRKGRDSYPSQGTGPSHETTWTMEFTDAVSAAQVAAESAERASMAARAAAELAGRGNISRQNSNDPNSSSIRSSRNAMQNQASSSMPKGERNEFVNMDLEFSSKVNNVGKEDDFRAESLSRMEHVGSEKKHDEASEFGEENVHRNYYRSSSASSIDALDDDTIFAGKQQTGNNNSQEIGEYKQHGSSDYSTPVFDEYDPEPNHFKQNLWDSFDVKKDDEVFSIPPSTSAANSIFFNDSIGERHTTAVEKVMSSKFDDHRSVNYDDSDGISSEEDDMTRSPKNEPALNSRLLHEGRVSGTDSSGFLQELQPASSPKAKLQAGNEEEKDQLQLPSSVGTEGSELAGGGEPDLKLGRLTGGLRNRGYNHPPYTASSVFDSSPSSKEMVGNIMFSNEPTVSQTITRPVIADEDIYDQESSSKAPTKPEPGKAKGSRLNKYFEISRSNKSLTVEDTSGFSTNHVPNNQEYIKQDLYDSTATNDVEEAIDQKMYDEKPRTKANKKLSARMSRTDFDHDGDKGDMDLQTNIGGSRNTNANSNIKLSRRTRGFFAKDRNNVPTSSRYSDTPNTSSGIQPHSQAVDESKSLQTNPSLGSRKPKSLSEQPANEHLVDRVNNKNLEGRTSVDTAAAASSGNIKASDSGGGGMKLQGTDSPKASHVHPKLPDYDTLAAHFQSLRSNHH